MRVAVVDNWRNVRSTPAEPLTAASNPVAVLRELLSRHKNATTNPHVEIECDEEFSNALKDAAQLNSPHIDPMKSTPRNFDGVRIVVSAPALAAVIPDAPTEEAPPSPTTTRKR